VARWFKAGVPRQLKRPLRFIWPFLACAALAIAVAGWVAVWWEAHLLSRVHVGMRFEELEALFGRPAWTGGMDPDLRFMTRKLKFRVPPLAGHCLASTAVKAGSYATSDELPWILSPRTARQVWMFRTGLITGILVYPDDNYRAACVYGVPAPEVDTSVASNWVSESGRRALG